jgi:hypothetical protein
MLCFNDSTFPRAMRVHAVHSHGDLLLINLIRSGC